MTPLDAARHYRTRGWAVVPVPHRSKNPGFAGWEQTRFSIEQLPQHFGDEPQNIGVLLGEPSGGLADVDLDCPQAIALAPAFLPETGCIFGRAGKPRSHWLYVAEPSVSTVKFADVRDQLEDGRKKRPMLVELRSTGAQTVFPSSTHESGEAIHFAEEGIPAKVPGSALREAVSHLAAACLLARHWPGEGSRHATAAALAGGLARSGWAKSNMARFIGVVAGAGGDDEIEDRKRLAEDTFDSHRRRQPTTGWKRLVELLGRDLVNKVGPWLGITPDDEKRLDEPLAGPAGEEPDPPPLPQPRSLRQLVQLFPGLRTPILHGLLRQGETMNVIAASKMGKSWLVTDLAISMASGRAWLGRYPVEKGNVLILDNELHGETSADRIPRVAAARGVLLDEIADSLHIENLRGNLRDIFHFGSYFQALEPGKFRLIILDAFYRFMPQDADENDNATMANIYNHLDRFADRLGCSFVLIHHATKGSQSGKAVTDVGAGAGSQSRATDTHLVLRAHEETDVVVLDAAVRSWAPIQPVCLRWNYPVWNVDPGLDPGQLRSENRRKNKPPVQPDAPGAVTLEWTPARFVNEFIGPEPQARDVIIARASLVISERKAVRLLTLAENDRQAFRWSTSNPKNPVRFATVEQPLLAMTEDKK